MAYGFYVTNTIAQAMATTLETALDAGTAAVIELYTTPTPADADASETGTLLVTLTCSATAGTVSDANPGAKITLGTVTSGTAVQTGTATHFRMKTQTGGTVCCQGTVSTAAADLILNTAAITSGSTVSVTAGTITIPEGP